MDDITASIIVACQTDGATAAVNKLGFSFAMLAREALNFGQKAVAEFRVTQDAAWKFGKTFRDNMGSAENAVHSFMDEYNLAESTARSMLTDTAQIMKGMGFAEKESLEVAESISRWGVDLASFTGYAGGAQGAVQAIIAAMMGENERLKGLGVVIREDSDEFRNMTKEIMQTKGVTEQHAKALAKLQLITVKAADAKGDYAAEGENFTQSVNNLNQQIKQAVSNIGEMIYHGFRLNDVFGSIGDGLKSMSQKWRSQKDTWIFVLKEMTINVEFSFKKIAVYIRPAIDAVNTLIGRFSALSEMIANGASLKDVAKAAYLDLAEVASPVGWGQQLGEKFNAWRAERKMHAEYGSDADIAAENLRRLEAGVTTMVEDEFALVTKKFGDHLNQLAKKFNVHMPQFKSLKDYDFAKEINRVNQEYWAALSANEEDFKKRLQKPKDNDVTTPPSAIASFAPVITADIAKAINTFRATAQSAIDANSLEGMRLQSRRLSLGKPEEWTKKTADGVSKIVDILKAFLPKGKVQSGLENVSAMVEPLLENVRDAWRQAGQSMNSNGGNVSPAPTITVPAPAVNVPAPSVITPPAPAVNVRVPSVKTPSVTVQAPESKAQTDFSWGQRTADGVATIVGQLREIGKSVMQKSAVTVRPPEVRAGDTSVTVQAPDGKAQEDFSWGQRTADGVATIVGQLREIGKSVMQKAAVTVRPPEVRAGDTSVTVQAPDGKAQTDFSWGQRTADGVATIVGQLREIGKSVMQKSAVTVRPPEVRAGDTSVTVQAPESKAQADFSWGQRTADGVATIVGQLREIGKSVAVPPPTALRLPEMPRPAASVPVIAPRIQPAGGQGQSPVVWSEILAQLKALVAQASNTTGDVEIIARQVSNISTNGLKMALNTRKY